MYWDASQAGSSAPLFKAGAGFKGSRRARTNSTSIACASPRKWFDIQKEVQFAVEAYDMGVFEDRAPNDGRYRGL